MRLDQQANNFSKQFAHDSLIKVTGVIESGRPYGLYLALHANVNNKDDMSFIVGRIVKVNKVLLELEEADHLKKYSKIYKVITMISDIKMIHSRRQEFILEELT